MNLIYILYSFLFSKIHCLYIYMWKTNKYSHILSIYFCSKFAVRSIYKLNYLRSSYVRVFLRHTLIFGEWKKNKRNCKKI